ncbi:alpha/beta fold hydrolase [Saccharomonospora azurea]|uniref:alpha/beta fold hydrolase n=1 Tax=Saccharomonospora azurea TaxID=40988 RepID=UPI0024095BA7|nr:alpha/beta hydrolase [Saccharomonospora azurea]
MYGVAPPERLGEFRLADGRVLGWSEWGPPTGRPVLLCPGAATSRRLGFGSDHVHELGVRLIGLDRPGLGVSSPAPGRTVGRTVGRALSDFAGDVEQFVEARCGEAPVVVGFSQGAPFALACAVAGLPSALYLVSAADEVARWHAAGALDGHLATLVDLCARDPDAAYERFLAFDADAVHRMVLAGSPARDAAVYAEPVFDAAYRTALAEGFAQGPHGYATDTLAAMRPWRLDLDRVSCAVELWYGDEDTGHSPDNGCTLADRIPGAVRRVLPGEAGSVLWTCGEALLRRIVT